MVDGYDELPDEYQKKIDYALANHHVHDDDWNGVSFLRCNRVLPCPFADHHRMSRRTEMVTAACALPKPN
jgi:hypothetical protein